MRMKAAADLAFFGTMSLLQKLQIRMQFEQAFEEALVRYSRRVGVRQSEEGPWD
jgi:hypothetical protein